MFCMEGKKNVKVAITWRFPMISLLSSEAPALIDLCRHQWQPATLKTLPIADDAVAEHRASIITDFLKISGERKTQKMSKKKVQISSKQPTLQSMSARTCSDPLWVTDLRDSRSTLSLSASKLYFLAMGDSRFFACAQTRTNPLVRSNKRFRSACGGEKTYTFAALIAHWCSITMENHHF